VDLNLLESTWKIIREKNVKPMKANEYMSRNREIKNAVELFIFLKILGIKITQYINPLAKLIEITDIIIKKMNMQHWKNVFSKLYI
jgi:hypothetical protein